MRSPTSSRSLMSSCWTSRRMLSRWQRWSRHRPVRHGVSQVRPALTQGLPGLPSIRHAAVPISLLTAPQLANSCFPPLFDQLHRRGLHLTACTSSP